jgi:hypothetical protein
VSVTGRTGRLTAGLLLAVTMAASPALFGGLAVADARPAPSADGQSGFCGLAVVNPASPLPCTGDAHGTNGTDGGNGPGGSPGANGTTANGYGY